MLRISGNIGFVLFQYPWNITSNRSIVNNPIFSFYHTILCLVFYIIQWRCATIRHRASRRAKVLHFHDFFSSVLGTPNLQFFVVFEVVWEWFWVPSGTLFVYSWILWAPLEGLLGAFGPFLEHLGHQARKSSELRRFPWRNAPPILEFLGFV